MAPNVRCKALVVLLAPPSGSLAAALPSKLSGAATTQAQLLLGETQDILERLEGRSCGVRVPDCSLLTWGASCERGMARNALGPSSADAAHVLRELVQAAFQPMEAALDVLFVTPTTTALVTLADAGAAALSPAPPEAAEATARVPLPTVIATLARQARVALAADVDAAAESRLYLDVRAERTIPSRRFARTPLTQKNKVGLARVLRHAPADVGQRRRRGCDGGRHLHVVPDPGVAF